MESYKDKATAVPEGFRLRNRSFVSLSNSTAASRGMSVASASRDATPHTTTSFTQEASMRRKLYLATLTAAALAAGSLVAPPASANNAGWSVSVGAPGVAIAAGTPVYYGYPYRVYGPRYYGPYHR